MAEYHTLDTPEKRKHFNELVMQRVLQGQDVTVKFEKPVSHRTLTQNSAMHLWFEMVASYLNDAGLDMRKTIKEEVDIAWSKHTVKEYLWKPLQEVVTGKESTTEANKTEYGDIEAVMRRHFLQKFGIDLPDWPRNAE